MKKNYVKIVMLILAFAVVLSAFASCDSSGKPGGASSGGVETLSDKYEKEVVYTTVRPSTADPKMPADMTLENNPYTKFMKDELNVSYKILWSDMAYDERIALDITNGTLPDIFVINDYSMYQQLYEADMLQDMTDFYENYATEKIKASYNSYPGIFDSVTENGRIMAIPGTANGYQQELLWVRKDWLDALGLEPPKTIEDITKVGKAFVEQDPDGNGKADTIGININREGSFKGYRNSYGLELVASAMGAFPRQWMKDDSGKLFYGSVQPEFKQTLTLVREWVDAGIIDQGCFEQGWETIWGNTTNGKAGMWFFPWNWALNNTEFKEKNPRAEVICYPAPLDTNGSGKVTYFTGAPYENILCVRKGYEHPEVIFKVFDLYQKMESGQNKAGYEALKPVRDAQTVWHHIAPLGTFDIRDDDVIPKNSKKIDAYVKDGTEPENFNEFTKVLWDQATSWMNNRENPKEWGFYTSSLLACLLTDDPIFNPKKPAFFYRTRDMIDLWDYLAVLENDAIRTIMRGDNGIEYFDKFVADWKEQGGDELTAEIEKTINK